MTQPEFFTRNRRALVAALQKRRGFEGLIVIAGSGQMQISADRTFVFEQEGSFLYLTGLDEPGAVLVIDNHEQYLIVPKRSVSRIAFEGAVDAKAILQTSGISDVYESTEGWERLTRRLNKIKHVATLQAPDTYIESIDTYTNPARAHLVKRLKSVAKGVRILDARPEIAQLRMIKSEYEVGLIEQAIAHAKKLFTAIERQRLAAENERDLLAEITRIRIKDGLINAYEPIIASGANAVTLHYVANNSPIDKKGLLLLDIGVKYQHYSADISRTVSYAPNKRQRAVYDAVLAIQQEIIAILKPGVTFKECELHVMQLMGEKLRELGLIKTISNEAIRQYYPHSISHFLGIDVHDVGDYSRPMEPGMVITVEPGIYIPQEGIGVRLEDDVLITQNGCRNLSRKLPKNIASLTIKA